MDPELVATRNCYQGWSGEKQRAFLRQLAATGSVTRAAEAVGMTARSAYYLRNRPEAKAFREGWHHALKAASDTLVAIAFDRAVNGGLQKYWQDGKPVGERLVPSDRMLTWLLARVAPRLPVRHGGSSETPWDDLLESVVTLPDFHPNWHDARELERLDAENPPAPPAEPQPEPFAILPAATPLPAPAEARSSRPARAARARPRARTHESA